MQQASARNRSLDALRYMFEAGYAVAMKGDPSPATAATISELMRQP